MASDDELPEVRTRVWLELADPDWDPAADPTGPATSYRFDLTWLTSSWTCIFGAGCPGIEASRPDAGCCAHGAWFSEPADEERVAAAVSRLDRSTWANHDHPTAGRDAWVVEDEEGDRRTATVDGACVFHNPPSFAGGHGCALHGLAVAEGRAPLELKPDVCWQLPVRRTYDEITRPDGSEVLQVTVTEYTRRDWGTGGADLDWFCTTSPAAHVGPAPVWVSLADELTELLGEAVYERLAEHCAAVTGVRKGPGERRLLPLSVLTHPATAAATDHAAESARRGG